jgi:hypothetical protein
MTKRMQNSSRCQHYDSLDRRCRIPRIDTHPAFCYLHAKAEREVRDADLRRNKLPTYCTFYTATDVNQALGRVFNLLSQDRIPAREAAVLAYVSQLLLQTIDGVRYETQLALGFQGYENLVRNVIDPPQNKLPAASNATRKASPDGHTPMEPAVSHPSTGATHEPSCTMNPSHSKESS